MIRARFMRHVVSTTGISILQQFVGLARQALIAAYFGLTRDYDGYLVVFSLATILVFILSSVFDTVAVSRLVQIRDRDGDAAFRASSNRLLLQALGCGLLLSAGLVLLVWIALPVVAAGFAPAERRHVAGLAPYFVPWVVIIVPYYALSAHLKALWQFNWVFGAEVLVMLVSISLLVLFHGDVSRLPIAYAAGYAAAFAVLLLRRGLFRGASSAPKQGLAASMANQYLANQVGGLTGLVDRYFQSFLLAGGISALGYAGQIVNNLSSLLTFREIYVVPLASEAGRREKLERILQGVVLISVPCAVFIMIYAEPIIRLLFQRGHFTADAARVTAEVFRIQALSLVLSSALAPMVRIFQIVNRIGYSHLLYLASLISTAAFNYLFVFRLGLDVRGVAFAMVSNSLVVFLVVAGLVRNCGIQIRWERILGYVLYAGAAAGAAAALSLLATTHLTGVVALFASGMVYSVVVGAGLFAIRDRLRAIVG